MNACFGQSMITTKEKAPAQSLYFAEAHIIIKPMLFFLSLSILLQISSDIVHLR